LSIKRSKVCNAKTVTNINYIHVHNALRFLEKELYAKELSQRRESATE